MTQYFRDRDGRPLTIVRGSARTDRYHVHDLQGNPKDLTGATECSFLLAASPSAEALDLHLTLGNGVAHTSSDGAVVVEISTAQTEALPLGELWGELVIRDAAGTRDAIGGMVRVVDSLVTVP